MASETLKSVIVGTAGHIDHGKSALVEALTGTHPDRLAEEKRRGITIDLGFAFLEENGVRFGFIDLPGLVKLEIEEYLRGSFLERAPIVAVSAKTGAGLPELKRALYSIAQQTP